jgi:peptidoglycan/xylan/chitin deacetylase (PgdA/CDA1 family)
MNEPSAIGRHPSGPARRWKPTPLIAGTVALHAGALAAVLAQPGAWPWAVGSVFASHAALTAAGLWPRSTLLGPNWTRLPADAGRRIALTIDDGPDPEVTPRVLDLLERHDARATFFCIGDLARRHPRWIEAIVARGHAVENHSQRHRHTFSLTGPAALRREIAAAQQTLTELTGTRPQFFRAPAGLRNPFLEPVLASSACSSRAGRAAASTRARATRASSRSGCSTASRRATSCSCTTGTPRVMRAAYRSCSTCCPRCCARLPTRNCSGRRCAPPPRPSRPQRASGRACKGPRLINSDHARRAGRRCCRARSGSRMRSS